MDKQTTIQPDNFHALFREFTVSVAANATNPRAGGRNIVSPEQILEYCRKLRDLNPAGEIYPEGITWSFRGLAFSKAFTVLPGRYPALVFENCWFESGITLIDVTLDGPLRLERCDLQKHDAVSATVHLVRVICRDQLHSTSSSIDSVLCDDTVFEDTVYFLQSSVHSINGGTFKKDLFFSNNARVRELFDLHVHDTATLIFDSNKPSVITGCHFYKNVNVIAESTTTPLFALAISHSTFSDDVVFDQLTVEHSTTIELCRFERHATFRRCALRHRNMIRDVSFSIPPFFDDDCVLSSDTHIERCRFGSVATEYDLTAYRELRHVARHKMRSSFHDSMFFALEQRTLSHIAWRNRQLGHAFLSSMYWLGSNYGQSILRPIIGLGYAWVLSWAVLWRWGAWPRTNDRYAYLADDPVFGLATQNLIAPFTFIAHTSKFAPTDFVGFAISVLESIATISLIALLILAIRRRFKKESE